MLMPSILRILEQSHIQPKPAERPMPGFSAELAAARENISGLERIEQEIAAAAALLKPANTELPKAEYIPSGSGLEELLRSIAKLEQSNQSRVVDFFE